MQTKKQPVPQGLSKRLTAFDLFTIGFGAIIGVGWVLVIGDWVDMGGGPLATTLAFLAGAVCLYPVARVFGALSVAMPVAGGAFVYTLRAFGRRAAFATGWLLTLAYVMMCPWEIIAIGQLAQTLFPVLASVPLYSIGGQTVYLPTLALCLCVAGLVMYLNHTGIDRVTRVQKLLVLALLGISVMIIVTAAALGNPQNLLPLVAETSGNPAASFPTGFLSVLAMAPFFYSGFDTVGQGAEEVSGTADKRRVGSISSLSVCSAGVFYALIIPAVCMVLPWRRMLSLNLPAAEVFSAGLGLNALKVVVVIGAFCGLFTTLNSFYVAGARLMLSMGRESLLPAAFARIHPQYRTPYAANFCIGLLGVAGAFLSKGLLLPIINVCSLGYIFAWLAVGLASLKIRRMPGLSFPYPVSAGLNKLAVVPAFAMLLLLIVPGSPGALVWPLEIGIVAVWLALGFALYAGRKSAAPNQSAAAGGQSPC